MQCSTGSSERIGWDQPFDRGAGTVKRGRGIAIGFKASIAPTTSVGEHRHLCRRQLHALLRHRRHGPGLQTRRWRRSPRETLGMEAEAVRVVTPDTDVTPYDMGTLGSRSTFHMGHAVRLAAEEARTKLAALAAETGVPPGTNLPIAELFRRKYGMQAGNDRRHRQLYSALRVARIHATGLTPECDALLDDRRRRR